MILTSVLQKMSVTSSVTSHIIYYYAYHLGLGANDVASFTLRSKWGRLIYFFKKNTQSDLKIWAETLPIFFVTVRVWYEYVKIVLLLLQYDYKKYNFYIELLTASVRIDH